MTAIEEWQSGGGSACRAILDQLPHWFGVAEANDEYVALAERGPVVVARVDDEVVGILVLRRDKPRAAEVYLLAVSPDRHRQGIGRALLRHVEAALAADGAEFLEVMTLSASAPDEGYARTRAFYLAYGFRELHEFPDLWGETDPAVQMVKAVRA